MKQIFLKVLKDGTTTSNVSSLIFDGENLTTKVSIDYSNVDFSDWIKQADIFVGQTRETDYVYTSEVGNVLEFTLEEGHLVKGYLRIQPLVKRLEEGSIYSKQKWETIELKVKKSLNVLEDDISVTQSIAEQWEIRIEAVEQAELVRQTNEGTRVTNENTRISNENTRISNENTRISQESSRVNAENTRVTQENARNVFVAYNPLTPYVVGNKVSYNGSSYVCILNSTGNLPTNSTYWLLIAQKGEQGIQGDNTTASSVTNTPSGNISSTTVQGAINELDTEKADKLYATNLVTNGDFSNGTTGWTPSLGTFAIVGGELEITSTSATSDIRAFQTSNLRPNLNAKLYIKYKGRVNFSGSSRIRLLLRDGASGNVINENIISNPTQNQQYTYSAIITNGFTLVNDLYIALDYRSVNIGDKGYFDEGFIINLTSIFGAGKEPTKEQMDWLLAQKYTNSWFDGTKELTSITDLLTLVNTKANSIQQAWITPTLKNGWTQYSVNTIGYYKDTLGNVHLRGRINGGTIGVACFTLPQGYLPTQSYAFGATDANGTLKAVTVSITGDVVIWATPTTFACLDNIYFRAI